MRIEVADWSYDFVGETFIKLENGALLHSKEWNGDVYTVKEGEPGRTIEVAYKPIMVGRGEPDEDGEYAEYETVAFERLP